MLLRPHNEIKVENGTGSLLLTVPRILIINWIFKINLKLSFLPPENSGKNAWKSPWCIALLG